MNRKVNSRTGLHQFLCPVAEGNTQEMDRDHTSQNGSSSLFTRPVDFPSPTSYNYVQGFPNLHSRFLRRQGLLEFGSKLTDLPICKYFFAENNSRICQ